MQVKNLLRFFAQPKYSITTVKLIGYELFIREKQALTNDWQVPTDFSRFTPTIVTTLLADTLKLFPQGLSSVSFNLDQAQFIDLAYCDLLAALQRQIPIQLQIELTEHRGKGVQCITTEQLLQAAQAYQQAGLPICLDDVGTGTNQYTLVQNLAPFAFEYKFALQNVRQQLSVAEVNEQIGFWRQLALNQHKLFALEGFEFARDQAMIQRFQPDVVQGYYFGRPQILPTASDLY